MVIAAEAYRELSPSIQKHVSELLKFHPDYEKWEKSFQPGTPNLDLPIYVFMRASTWPDEIRRRGNEYDHPQWHYIDYPLKAPAFPVEPGPAPTDDVLYGISQCEKILSDPNALPKERAVYLSWLIHLVGDLHQPLHCCSWVNETYPNGDKGGNDFFVKPATRGIRLHSLWDGLLGTSGKPQAQLNNAIQIMAENPKKSLPELAKSRTPKEWSLESRALAIDKAYLRGQLKGGTNIESAGSLPDGYTDTAKVVAERQAALAGCRLANEIQEYVK